MPVVVVRADPSPRAVNGAPTALKVESVVIVVSVPPLAGGPSAVIAPARSDTASVPGLSAVLMPPALVVRRATAAIGPASIEAPALIARASIAPVLMAPAVAAAAAAVSGGPAVPRGGPRSRSAVLIAAPCAAIAIRPHPAGR